MATPPSPPSSQQSGSRRLAAIDIGTNSFHLVIADVRPNGVFTVIGRDKEMVRLGAGATDMKTLSDEAMERALQTLARFRRMVDLAQAPVRAVATSAVREALNRADFVERVRREVGIDVEVVSGYEEARLIYLGVLQALPVFHRQILLVDIGGGSTEFLVGREGDVVHANSLKVGAVRLTERFFRAPVISDADVAACRVFLRGELHPVQRAVREAGFTMAVGCSGTILTTAAIIQAAAGHEVSMVDQPVTITRSEIHDAVATILDAETVVRRRRIPGLDESRADIIVAGALILEQVVEQFGIDALTTSRYALREGVILDSVQKAGHGDGTRAHLSDIRRSSVLHLAEICHDDRRHADNVARLALELFDQSTALHRLGNRERELLEAAAFLHDIGYHISHTQHHRHSYYIIRNAELLGFTDREIEIIANTARYHRKSHPKMEHAEYARMTLQDRDIVLRLASLLRLADGLDRSHQAAVLSVQLEIDAREARLLISPEPAIDCTLEHWGAERRKALFEDVFKRRLTITLHP